MRPFLLLLVLLVPLPGAVAEEAGPVFGTGSVIVRADVGTRTFRVEVARTEPQRRRGLMFRRHLAADAGMLFLFDREGPVSMWMRNTRIPLDMLFIARGGRIVRIEERTVPLSEATIPSGSPVVAVLELNAGTVSRLGIRPGGRVMTSLPDAGF